jgi:tRNA-specific 2-thiouridylase
MKRERVVVAMSGGVDSAVAAARCVAAGHEVIGLSLRLAREGGHCCSLDDFHDARLVAERLGFPHYVLDESDAFERSVVEPFVAEYLAGRTPNPCALCNQHVKFGVLWRRARELGAARLATGHYARTGIDPETGRSVLRTARDAAKDQTYFLFGLDHANLARTLFPVGDLTKAEVRAQAEALGLAIATKPESMEVCFVPDGDAAGFVERRVGQDALRPGAIVDDGGIEVGRHAGVHRFTIGQRRGLGVAVGGRQYVRALDAATGRVTIARAPPHAHGLVAQRLSWIGGAAPADGSALAVRIRHRHPLLPARLTRTACGVAPVEFEREGPAVTPGQAAVFYRDETVLGGGWIAGGLEVAA